jgi:site-specific recombinase XerD
VFLESVQKEISPGDLKAYRALIIDFHAVLDPQRVSTEDIRKYIASCYERDFAAGIITRRISALREFFRFLFNRGRIQHNPMPAIFVPRRKSGLPLRNQAILETFRGSNGIRPSELRTARLNALDLENRVLTIFKPPGLSDLVPPDTRPILLNELAANALRAYLSERLRNWMFEGRFPAGLHWVPSDWPLFGRSEGEALTSVEFCRILNVYAVPDVQTLRKHLYRKMFV